MAKGRKPDSTVSHIIVQIKNDVPRNIETTKANQSKSFDIGLRTAVVRVQRVSPRRTNGKFQVRKQQGL